MIPKRVYAKINLDNVQKNIKPVVDRLKNKAQVMGIVKSDAYGHGAVEVSKALEEIGVACFGVAAANEAVELRRSGIDRPILILGQVFEESYPLILKYNIESVVSDIECARQMSDFALKNNSEFPVYIKIDTGMGRLGFQADEQGFENIKYIFNNLKGLKILGAFTHFANADCKDKTSAIKQKEKFIDFTDKIISSGYPLPVRHMYNSASVMELEDGYIGELVRCGMMIYGLYPSDEMDKSYPLYPVMELKSSVAFIKNVDKDFPVSYGSTYITSKPTKIATIPVGYADGYPRYLSNKGHVLIKGEECSILGRICMDQFMVDVSNIDDLQIGDTVTLVGSDGGKTITIEDISDPEYRFNYEFCCLINKRVPRVYYKNGKVIKIEDAYLDYE